MTQLNDEQRGRLRGYIDGLETAIGIIDTVVIHERAYHGHIPKGHTKRREALEEKIALPLLVRGRLIDRIGKLQVRMTAAPGGSDEA